MIRVCAGLLAILIASTAHADEPLGPPDPGLMDKIRELYEKKDYEGVRRELLKAYALVPHPALLFALGQVEFALENYQAAIDYYDKFIATQPSDEQVALAQQAIGAARAEMRKPKPVPIVPPEPRRREWYGSDTALVAIAGGAVAFGTGLVFWGRHIGNDHSDSLAAYDARAERATTYQWSGVGLAAAGAILAGVTIVRWRLRPNDDVVVEATGTGAAVKVRW